GRDHLYAHSGRRDPDSTVSDRKIRGKTGLCVDADRVSSWLPALWSCLESALINLLPPGPGHWRRYFTADGNDLAVSNLFPRGAGNGNKRDGRPIDGRASAWAGAGWLPGKLFRLAMGLLYQCAPGHCGCDHRTEGVAADATGTAGPLRCRGISHYCCWKCSLVVCSLSGDERR